MARLSKLNRRDFLLLTGITSTGLVLQASINPEVLAFANPGKAALSLNLFVHLATDGQVTIVAHRSEMGQGVRTSLPQIVADEMDADWSKVTILQAQADEQYGDQDTDGSHSIRSFFQTMREMGASAQFMLRQAAAATWSVDVASCRAENHVIIHQPSGRRLGYGALAEKAAQFPLPDVKTLHFKPESAYKYIGKPVTIVDMDAIVTGATQFGIDVVRPGMVHASIERCPVFGGKVKQFDASQALKVPGVLQVLHVGKAVEPASFNPLAGVAVIATNTWAAQEGRKKLVITWDLGAHATYDSRAMMAHFVAGKGEPAKQLRHRGDVDTAFKVADKTHRAVYSVPHLEHATMEPPAAVAEYVDGQCEVWACVQSPVRTRDVVAGAVGLPASKVTVNVTLLGGAFGRKSKPDFAAEAALLAKAVGRPVKVTWTREDAIQNGYYHAFSVQEYAAALDPSGNVSAITAKVASPSIMSLFAPKSDYLADFETGQGFANIPYNVPNIRAENTPTVAHTRIGWMRSVYNINHAFASNSFVDELARLSKRDSLDFQLEIIGADRVVETTDEGFPTFSYGAELSDYPFKTSRLKGALLAVKQSCGWPAKVGTSEGWGIAVHGSFLSYVAVATKVHLASDSVRVDEVHIAIDCGKIVNPDRVKSQMEGAVIFGLSLALYGEISFKDGAVEQSNFDNYPLLRMDRSPKIVVTIIESKEPHGGVGEPGVPPIAPSLVNAIVSAGGTRIRDLPVRRHYKKV